MIDFIKPVADFREAYTKLSFFKVNFPDVPVLALTATATRRVQSDVIAQLALKQCYVFRSSFNRPNLKYEVHIKPHKKLAEMLATRIFNDFAPRILGKRKLQCGILYCTTTKEVETLAEGLNNALKEKLGRNPSGHPYVR